MERSGSAKEATIAGTLLCILYNIRGEDIGRTILLAGIGAMVSFAVSVALNWAFNKWKQWKRQR